MNVCLYEDTCTVYGKFQKDGIQMLMHVLHTHVHTCTYSHTCTYRYCVCIVNTCTYVHV